MRRLFGSRKQKRSDFLAQDQTVRSKMSKHVTNVYKEMVHEMFLEDMLVYSFNIRDLGEEVMMKL